MLLTLRDRGDRRDVVLFHAAHDETRIIFRQELEALYRQAKGSEPRLRDRTVEPKDE